MTGMVKQRKALLFSVVFMLIAFSAYAQMIESRIRKTVRERRVQTIQEQVNELSKKVDLTVEQKTKIIEIMTKEKEDIDCLLQEAGDKIQELKNNNKKAIDALLIAEQRKKLQGSAKEKEDYDDPLKVFKSIY